MNRREFWTRFVGAAPAVAALAVGTPKSDTLQPIEPVMDGRRMQLDRFEELQARVNELVARENARNR